MSLIASVFDVGGNGHLQNGGSQFCTHIADHQEVITALSSHLCVDLPVSLHEFFLTKIVHSFELNSVHTCGQFLSVED
jgi:hypothetical protein